MALVHDFAVMSKNGDYFISNHNPNKIAIHDDIILYIADTIKWVIGFNPKQNNFVNGLCYHGITCFDSDLIQPFKNIITRWRDMFIHAPSHFVLTGNWETIVCDDNGGEYKTISVKRDGLLAQ